MLLGAFNPSRRDNMIAIMVGRADAPNYGRIVVYNFPKQKLVYGPRQIDARIDQDPVISQQLALWNQQGSRVLRGSLLAIPIDQSLIYVQPLYLSATEQGALARAAAGHRGVRQPDRHGAHPRAVARAHLRWPGCAGTSRRARDRGGRARPPRRRLDASSRALAQRAWEAWQKGQEALRRGDWAAYGEEQKRLEEALRQLREGR